MSPGSCRIRELGAWFGLVAVVPWLAEFGNSQ